ncbi:hypothetical protein K0U00_45030, partial [Paenibacillus sepulcri]|nr:hypothetical protein [Paenibacillus sepulcri]
VEFVAPGAHIDTSFRMIDGVMMLCAIPATIAYKLMLGEAPFKKGDVIPLSFGNVTVQSGVDGLRKFSWAGGLVGSFMSMILTGYQLYVQGNVVSEGGSSKPAEAWQLWLGAGLGVLGLATEALGMHVNKGEEVEAMEWTMLAITGILSVKTVALLVAGNKKEAPDRKKLQKVGSGIEVVGKVIHFIMRTAVFGKVIDDDSKSSSSSAGDEKSTES